MPLDCMIPPLPTLPNPPHYSHPAHQRQRTRIPVKRELVVRTEFADGYTIASNCERGVKKSDDAKSDGFEYSVHTQKRGRDHKHKPAWWRPRTCQPTPSTDDGDGGRTARLLQRTNATSKEVRVKPKRTTWIQFGPNTQEHANKYAIARETYSYQHLQPTPNDEEEHTQMEQWREQVQTQVVSHRCHSDALSGSIGN
mmetsp:Transcript_50426/g.60665  ORF Transcript_50426/g.60665 Transcript_50426/m.60665 type:complete len:197 (-) Transcript_50426:873-1463(-)